MLWAYRTTLHSATGEMLYFLAFGVEVMMPMKIGLPNHYTTHLFQEGNSDNLRVELDLLEEKQEVTSL